MIHQILSHQIFSILTIIGTWQYAGFQFEGKSYPLPNPELVLQFTFVEDQTVHLKWYRKNEPGFCERKGVYIIKEDLLWQRITWVNPENDVSCAGDPDMQLGRESATRILKVNDRLGLVFDLDGKELLYLLEKVDPAMH